MALVFRYEEQTLLCEISMRGSGLPRVSSWNPSAHIMLGNS